MQITREFLSSLSFRPFEQNDYFGFGGVESPVPLIAETDEFVVIIDGQRCEVFGETEDGDFREMGYCENITTL